MRRDLTFWKTYAVDLVLLVLLFFVGAFAKNKVANFFNMVGSYEARIQVLEPGLANQSLSALLQMEIVLKEFSQAVHGTYIFMAFVVPAAVFLLLVFSQSFTVSLNRGKVDYKLLLRSFALGIPFFVVFLLLESKLLGGFAFFLTDTVELVWFIALILLIVLMGYVWYALSIQLIAGKKLNYRDLYKKFHKWFPYYFLMALIFFVISILLGFLLVKHLTASFTDNNWIGVVAIMLALLALLQILRVKFIDAVLKFD